MNNSVQSFFSMPVMKKSELRELFLELDSLLESMLRIIDKNTFHVQGQFLSYYIEIASGTARFKSYYKKESNNRKNFGASMRGGYGPNDRKFLLKNYEILHLSNDEIKVKDFEFNRFVYHSIVEEFRNKTANYIKVSNSVAKGEYEYLAEKEKIEEVIKVKNSLLYGTVNQVNDLYSSFLQTRDKIMMPYLRYVYSLAIKNSKNYEQTMENFQAGTIGLMKAVLMYHKSRSSFGNYAKYWIKQAIMDNIYDSFTIKIPHCSWTYFNKLEKFRPTTENIEELSEASNFSTSHIKSIYKRILTSQVSSLDALLENNENLPSIMYELETQESPPLFNDLSDRELFVMGVIFGQHNIIPNNNILEQEILNERVRQNQK